MSNETTTRIFISHSHEDNPFCQRLVEDLQKTFGNEDVIWFDSHGGLHGGDLWWNKIMQEIKSRPYFLIILSPDSMNSRWVNSEIDLAWKQKHTLTGKNIIPILYRSCEIREDLDLLHIINFLAPLPYEEAFQNLLLALGIAKQQKTQEQEFEEVKFLFKAGKYQEALAILNQILTNDPNNLKVLAYRGTVYGTLKDYQKALLDFDRAIALDSKFAKAYSNRGTTYRFLQKHTKALSDLDRAIALDPNNADNYVSRGHLYLDQKKYQKALSDYNRAITLDINNVNAYIWRGQVYYMLQKYPKALSDLEQAIVLDPDNVLARTLREQVLHPPARTLQDKILRNLQRH